MQDVGNQFKYDKLLDTKATKLLIENICISPNSKLGQNFLIEPRFVKLAISYAKISSGDVVIEIGPGLGTLTIGLVAAGARVFAVEKDKKLFDNIIKKFNNINCKHADAVDFPVGSFDLSENYKIVANLPYAISSVWLDNVINLSILPEQMVLLVQKEAADRWFANHCTKSFCPLGIFLQSAYKLKDKCNVPKSSFYPQPNVDSVLIYMEKLENPVIFNSNVKQLIRTIFTRRRQQLQRICRELDCSLSKTLNAFLEKSTKNMASRPEELDIMFWQNFNSIIKHDEP